jgi:hypothetical protein
MQNGKQHIVTVIEPHQCGAQERPAGQVECAFGLSLRIFSRLVFAVEIKDRHG